MMISFFEVAFPVEEDKNLEEDDAQMDIERDLDMENGGDDFLINKAEMQFKFR